MMSKISKSSLILITHQSLDTTYQFLLDIISLDIKELNSPSFLIFCQKQKQKTPEKCRNAAE